MSRLLKLKKWLTLEEAAKHLSNAFTESVSEADVLRFALDERLNLSVNFINPVVVKLGSQMLKADVPYEDVVGIHGKVVRVNLGKQHITDDGKIYLFNETDFDYTLCGICDILMGDGARLEIERRYYSLTGGPKPIKKCDSGVLLEIVEKELCEFAMYREYSDIPNNIDCDELLTKHLADSQLSNEELFKFLSEKLEVIRKTSEYCIADQLPEEAVLVVRINALTAFIDSLSDAPSNVEKPVGIRERTSYQNIVGALLAQLTAGKANDTTVINQALTDYPNKPGISERKLQDVFAAAKRSLGAT